MDDSSDILGGQLHVARHGSFFSSSSFSFTSLFSATILVLAAFYGLQLLYPHYRQYQEKRYRKSMRRRHGIPDNDRRPFNVAYAAAKRAQKEREAAEKGKPRRSSSGLSVVGAQVAKQHVAAPTIQVTRPHRATAPSTQPLQGKDAEEIPQPRSSYLESRRTSGQTATASESEYHTPGVPQETGNEKLVRSASSSSLYAPAFARSAAPGAGHGKRALDDEGAQAQESKKTRLASDDMMDGVDEERAADADVDDDMDVDELSLAQPRRGAKRLASVDDDEGFESAQAIGRDNRPKKVARDDSLLRDMRGKKRDRAEAGSTFGGDDEVEAEADDSHRSQRRRRLGNKKSSGNLRGRKRVREPESVDSENDSDSSSKRAARHKRGKHSPLEDPWTSDDGMVSHDPLCKGRQIGEKWENNGVRYKVGLNGQRLRQTLVKKLRSRFPMPKDSEHPDRRANVDVYVETWLSEEEYQLAKERNELAWQSPKSSTIDLPATTDVLDSPSKGKNLLWSSTATKDMRKQQVLVKSVVASGNSRANPFQPSQNALVRRISTIFTPVIPTAPESPKLRPSRSYSKWEKQDLEAAAMTKLREKVKSDAPVIPEKKTVTFALGHTSIPPSGIPPQASVTDSSATSKSTNAAKPSTSFSFGNSATTGAALPTKASTSDLPSLTIPTSAAKPAATVQPSGPSSTAKIPAAAPPASTPFSLGNSPAVQPAASSTSAQPSAATVTDFFAKPAAPPASSTFNGFGAPAGRSTPAATPHPTSTPNMFGSAPQPSSISAAQTTSNTSSQSVANPFGFGAPAKQSDDKPARPAQTSSTGPSLLARMGAFSNAPAPSATINTPSVPTSQPISFAKPGAPASATVPAASTSESSGSNAPVKFNFGVTPKATPAPATNYAPATTPAGDVTKDATTFAFGATSTPAVDTKATSEAPKNFGFGASAASGTSVFGSTGISPAFGGATTFPRDAPATPNPKSAFAMPKTPANTTVFGASTTPAGTPSGSIFAQPAPTTPANVSAFSDAMSTTPIATPPTTSAFGNNVPSTTPAGPPPTKPMFSFTNNPTSGSSAPLFGNTSKPAVPSSTPLFGQPTSSNASSNQPAGTQASTSKSLFSFTAPPAANGVAPNTSFGFTGGNATSTPAASAGASTAAPSQNKSMFHFGSGGSTATPAFGSMAFGSSNSGAAGSSAASTGQTAKPTPTPSMFGFGAPTGSTPFAFGQTKPPGSSQK